MRLLVINPNTTASMTEKIGLAARSAAKERSVQQTIALVRSYLK